MIFMKKIMLFTAFLFTVLVNAQDFPGEKIELLTNKQLKVKPVEEASQKYGYRGFFKDEKLQNIYKKKGYTTQYTELVGKVFNVVSFEPYRNSIQEKKFKLKIESKETGVLYFDYDPKYSHTFPFEVIGGLQYPEGFYCDAMLEKETNDANKRKYEFPFVNGIQLIKTVDPKHTFVFAVINVPSADKEPAGVIRRGVTVTFDNGGTIELPEEKISSDDNGAGGTVYRAIIGFRDPAHAKLLKENKIVKIKLNKFERNFSEGATLQEYAKCFFK